MRCLDAEFMDDLQQGCLAPILKRIKNDNTLMLAIRGGYINIYYRGGNLLRLSKAKRARRYEPFFDSNYLISKNAGLQAWLKDNAGALVSTADADRWVEKFGELKQEMDIFLTKKKKDEREFQQLIVRENNFSRLANETEFFFTDIEYTSPRADAGDIDASPLAGRGFRFDMLGVEWLASDRKHAMAGHCRPVIVEVKYGDKALGGSAGLTKHLQDIRAFLDTCRNELVDTLNDQLTQLQKLELLGIKKNDMQLRATLEKRPLVIFVIANSNPRGTKLKKEVDELARLLGTGDPGFDLAFFVANFAGYAMHSCNMEDIATFTRRLEEAERSKKR